MHFGNRAADSRPTRLRRLWAFKCCGGAKCRDVLPTLLEYLRCTKRDLYGASILVDRRRKEGSRASIAICGSLQNLQWRPDMLKISHLCATILLTCVPDVLAAADALAWPQTLPVYDHIVIVVEENKDFEQIFGGKFNAPYLKQLAAEGACISRMFGEEHPSQGNYFWLFSGSNQNVGFSDAVPSAANHPGDYPFRASNLGEQLI